MSFLKKTALIGLTLCMVLAAPPKGKKGKPRPSNDTSAFAGAGCASPPVVLDLDQIDMLERCFALRSAMKDFFNLYIDALTRPGPRDGLARRALAKDLEPVKAKLIARQGKAKARVVPSADDVLREYKEGLTVRWLELLQELIDMLHDFKREVVFGDEEAKKLLGSFIQFFARLKRDIESRAPFRVVFDVGYFNALCWYLAAIEVSGRVELASVFESWVRKVQVECVLPLQDIEWAPVELIRFGSSGAILSPEAYMPCASDSSEMPIGIDASKVLEGSEFIITLAFRDIKPKSTSFAAVVSSVHKDMFIQWMLVVKDEVCKRCNVEHPSAAPFLERFDDMIAHVRADISSLRPDGKPWGMYDFGVIAEGLRCIARSNRKLAMSLFFSLSESFKEAFELDKCSLHERSGVEKMLTAKAAFMRAGGEETAFSVVGRRVPIKVVGVASQAKISAMHRFIDATLRLKKIHEERRATRAACAGSAGLGVRAAYEEDLDLVPAVCRDAEVLFQGALDSEGAAVAFTNVLKAFSDQLRVVADDASREALWWWLTDICIVGHWASVLRSEELYEIMSGYAAVENLIETIKEYVDREERELKGK